MTKKPPARLSRPRTGPAAPAPAHGDGPTSPSAPTGRTEPTPLDCRSPEGITVGLIDGIIAAARVLRDRDMTAPAVAEALADLAADEDVAWLTLRGEH